MTKRPFSPELWADAIMKDFKDSVNMGQRLRMRLREEIVAELKPLGLLADIEVYTEDSAQHGNKIVLQRKGYDWGVVTESYDLNAVKLLLTNLANNHK